MRDALFLIGAATETGFTRGSLLSSLLTTEGLLFAALSVSVSLSSSSTFGPKTIVPPAALAFTAAFVLSVVALAAGLAWTDVLGGNDWPSGTNGRIEALILLFAIIVQPLVALVIAIGIWRG